MDENLTWNLKWQVMNNVSLSNKLDAKPNSHIEVGLLQKQFHHDLKNT